MSAFPNSPRLIRGGIVLIDPDTAAVQRIIALQYNPDSLTRSFQVKGIAAEAGDRIEAMRLTGPPVETYKLEAEIDGTDQLEFPDQNPTVTDVGIQAHLAALETIVYPTVAHIQANNGLAQAGTLEILPLETSLVLFVWSKNRVVPVVITEFNITEEAFDPALNPIRAKVSLGLRVLSSNDLPFSHRGNSLFLAYQQQKERLASKHQSGPLSALGISRIS